MMADDLELLRAFVLSDRASLLWFTVLPRHRMTILNLGSLAKIADPHT